MLLEINILQATQVESVIIEIERYIREVAEVSQWAQRASSKEEGLINKVVVDCYYH